MHSLQVAHNTSHAHARRTLKQSDALADIATETEIAVTQFTCLGFDAEETRQLASYGSNSKHLPNIKRQRSLFESDGALKKAEASTHG